MMANIEELGVNELQDDETKGTTREAAGAEKKLLPSTFTMLLKKRKAYYTTMRERKELAGYASATWVACEKCANCLGMMLPCQMESQNGKKERKWFCSSELS